MMRTVLIMVLMVAGKVPGQFTIEFAKDDLAPADADFREDWLKLEVRQGTNVIHTHRFISSYGITDGEVVSGPHANYLLLEFGEGRGTSARTGYLAVFEMLDRLTEIARIPIAGYAGTDVEWNYKYAVRATSNGIEILLARNVRLFHPDSVPEGLPSDRKRIIRIESGLANTMPVTGTKKRGPGREVIRPAVPSGTAPRDSPRH
jgi:hypothetical protein